MFQEGTAIPSDSKNNLPGGESNPVYRVTGGDTYHYTTEYKYYVLHATLQLYMHVAHMINECSIK